MLIDSIRLARTSQGVRSFVRSRFEARLTSRRGVAPMQLSGLLALAVATLLPLGCSPSVAMSAGQQHVMSGAHLELVRTDRPGFPVDSSFDPEARISGRMGNAPRSWEDRTRWDLDSAPPARAPLPAGDALILFDAELFRANVRAIAFPAGDYVPFASEAPDSPRSTRQRAYDRFCFAPLRAGLPYRDAKGAFLFSHLPPGPYVFELWGFPSSDQGIPDAVFELEIAEGENSFRLIR